MPSFLKKSSATVIYGTITRYSFKQNEKMGIQPVFKNLIKTRNLPILKKYMGGNPNIFGPQHDCGACGGGGCSRCS